MSYQFRERPAKRRRGKEERKKAQRAVMPSTVHARMNGAIRDCYRYYVSPLLATMSQRIERPRSLGSSVAYANMRLGYRVLQSLGDILQLCNIQLSHI